MLRLVAAWTLALVMAARSPAADAKPNTLTPQEIADGWLLLFDGETTFGWKIDGEASVRDSVLVLGSKRESAISTTSYFGDSFQLRFEYSAVGGDTALVNAVWKDGFMGSGLLRVVGGKDGWHDVVADKDYDAAKRRQVFNTSKDNVLRSEGRLPQEDSSGTRVEFRVSAGTQLSLRSIKLRPLGLKPIFNGKDLTGCHKVVTERTKSEFSVRDGELRIKSGPGDLETDGQWDDFVLRLDCRTNGKHLNSGVFFRCIPGLYLRGYEVQIHNDFTADPPREYAIQEFDPETHKPLGKKKVKSAAKDYGTGAVYNRAPARKQMAKDNEWFTMTVVAEGKHFAVWVNGVQVSDWTDNRQPSDNPRQGCRLEKGTISLQGHDPTTDLSFRNFRIAPLPKKP